MRTTKPGFSFSDVVMMNWSGKSADDDDDESADSSSTSGSSHTVVNSQNLATFVEKETARTRTVEMKAFGLEK